MLSALAAALPQRASLGLGFGLRFLVLLDTLGAVGGGGVVRNTFVLLGMSPALTPPTPVAGWLWMSEPMLGLAVGALAFLEAALGLPSCCPLGMTGVHIMGGDMRSPAGASPD